MEIRCPACKKVNRDSLTCVRCGCDIKILYHIVKSANSEISLAQKELLDGNPDEALEHAIRSWSLKKTVESAKLAFLSHVAGKRYREAIQWHNRTQAL